jgi:hypothetical protein
VWLRDRAHLTECLRIGRHAVERWTTVDAALALSATHALPQSSTPNPQRIAEAIAALYADAPDTPVALVLESAWLPVMLVDTGKTLLRAAQVEALVRHRFRLLHSDGLDPVSAWELRIEHRAGGRHALAYGMTPRLKQTLIDAARAVGLRWAAMTPAFDWGLGRLRPAKAWPRSTGWFAWTEQDRTLLARIESKQLVGFNAGAPRVADASSLLALVDAEGVRLGIESSSDPIGAATWGSAPSAARVGERVTWFDVRGDGRVSAASRLGSQTTRVPA